MARRGGGRARWRVLGAVALAAIIGGTGGWWHLRHWRPDRQAWAVQGVEIGAEDGVVDWPAVKAIGADFAYVDASASAFARDPRFVANLDGARAAGLDVGAVHRFDPCQPADRQAGNFVTVVPRDAALLPPVVELDRLADDCPVGVPEAAIESELTTLINRIETHTGRPVILKVSSRFQGRYAIAARVDRNLWLVGDRFQPDYAGRPWTLWTANAALMNEAVAGPLRWVVAQP